MSHAVQINYEQIAVQCHSICEVAQNQVAELDKMLANLKGSCRRYALKEQERSAKAQLAAIFILLTQKSKPIKIESYVI